MGAPTEDLTEIIVPKLIELGLLLKCDALKLKTKISSGTISAEDWLLAVDKATEKGKK